LKKAEEKRAAGDQGDPATAIAESIVIPQGREPG